jgi:tryptophanyl-tRNA synthetase
VTDSPEEIHRKVMSALTDSTNSVSYEPETRAEVSNLLHLLSHFDAKERTPEEIARDCSGLDLRNFKTKISDTIAENLAPIRQRYGELMGEDDGAYVDHVEKTGAKKARESADATMAVVREAVGL